MTSMTEDTATVNVTAEAVYEKYRANADAELQPTVQRLSAALRAER